MSERTHGAPERFRGCDLVHIFLRSSIASWPISRALTVPERFRGGAKVEIV